LLFRKDIPLIFDNCSVEYNNLIEEMRNNVDIKQAIFVFNAYTKEYIEKYDGIILAEKALKIRHEVIKDSILNNKIIDKYIFSYHRLLDIPHY
jgi:2-keto-4-pentenoate hydratase/2-oxohepta-3-ene-1,7-dioic acid hydratase in catechol pathway